MAPTEAMQRLLYLTRPSVHVQQCTYILVHMISFHYKFESVEVPPREVLRSICLGYFFLLFRQSSVLFNTDGNSIWERRTRGTRDRERHHSSDVHLISEPPVAYTLYLFVGTMSTAVSQASDEARVVVLGGGLAGLRCAQELVSKHGFSKDHVVLLEASTSIGGRIKTDTSFVEGFSVSGPARWSHVLLLVQDETRHACVGDVHG